jgi:hypothetical protein
MTASYLSWENFRKTVFVAGQKRVHRISSSPKIEVFGDGEAREIGLLIEIPPGTELPPDLDSLAVIRATVVRPKGTHLLEVRCMATRLERQFYHFASAVAERVLVEKMAAVDAVRLELQSFSELLEVKTALGIERQIGILGELLFLELLIGRMPGSDALAAWLGPYGEPHDFRAGDREYEVKATVGTRRIHTIHGAEQLVPSHECHLYVVSVMLGPPGASSGFSLPEKLSDVANLLPETLETKARFHTALERLGYRANDASQYTRRYVLRRPIAMACVDGFFPALTRPLLQASLKQLADRVESVQYDVDIEGLEHDAGSAQFQSWLPS